MGTAAHAAEPTLPGARESYLDLGRFYDALRLEKRREELAALTGRYKAAYRRAYACLAAAGALEPEEAPLFYGETEAAAARCLALLPAAAPEAGGKRTLFLEAFSRRGMLSLMEQLSSWQRRNLSGGPAAVSAVLNRVADRLGQSGFSTVCCRDPLRPALTKDLLIPTLRYAFLRTSREEAFLALPLPETHEALAREQDALLSLAAEAIGEAGRVHDKLEEVYNPCVDFAGVYEEAEKHIHTIL